jgi:hypothetical protein
LSNPSENIRRLGLFRKVVIRMVVSWSWRSTQWVAGEGSSYSGGRGWNKVADELWKVLVFLETTSGSSPVGVLSPVEKDGKKVLGLKVSSPSSGGAWSLLGGALLSFAEVVRSEGPFKLQISQVERRDLDLLLAVRPAASEVRLALDCSVLEKKPVGKDLLLNLQGKDHHARLLSAQGAPGLVRKSLPRLNLQTWRNILVRFVGQIVGSLMGRSLAFGLGLKPIFSFKGAGF